MDQLEKSSFKNVIQVYVVFSFLSSFFLWMGSYFIDAQAFFLDTFFLHGLFVFNTYFYFAHLAWNYYPNKKELSYYLLGQSLLIVGQAFESRSYGGLFLALLPIVMSLFMSSTAKGSRKSFALLGIVAFSCLVFPKVLPPQTDGLFPRKVDFLAFSSFCLWMVGLIYYAPLRNYRSLFAWVFKNKRQGDFDLQGEKLFHHDLINQIHGIQLFLQYRSSVQRPIEVNEIGLLKGEVKTLLSLLKNHYDLKHRDLMTVSEYISFAEVRESIHQIVQSFLPTHLTRCQVKYQGELIENGMGQVHHSTFIRVITNLIKNAAEQRPEDVALIFDYQSQGLEVVVENSIPHLNQQSNFLPKLEEFILSEETHKNNEGLGLESVSYLCEKLGGQFKFGLSDGLWRCRVFLPNPNLLEEKEDFKADEAA